MYIKTLEEIKNKLIELKPYLREKYKIKEIGIFGYYVRRKQKKGSDLDILLEFEETPDLFTYIEIESFLSKKLKVRVDLIMKSALKPYMGRRILKEVVYI
ncbi:MAG: nucleotidyltransferase family protein [Aquificaceae bacterium]|uniref:nucleotidyltransferase family protein n=1 Tax=Hydrogenobacter sp. Uz 6-8 TaxID=3384828 RepID=UPI003095BD29